MATMTPEQLAEQLRTAYGGALRAVVLYGSAVAGEHIAKRSDYNVLVIADELPPERLHAVSSVARAWSDAGNPPPMTFTWAEWRGSADVFPMEYADVLERHRVLLGDPPFEGITVARADLRLQVEHEVLGKLLRLRQGALMAGTDAKRQIELLSASLSTIMVVFRGVVRLEGGTPPQNYEELSRELGRIAGLDPAPFIAVVRHVRGEQAIAKEQAGGVLTGYLSGLTRLTAYVGSRPS